MNKEQYAVYEKEPMHGRDVNGVILAPYNSKEEAQEAANKYGYNTDNYFVDKLTYESDNDYVGKETTIDFGRDLRMSQPWRSYSSDEVFTIVKKTKSGLYLLRDSKGNEHPLSKSRINYFKK